MGKWVGGLLLFVYIGLVIAQWANVDVPDKPYARRTDLLDGLEAVAFAAAGAILGTTVQRRVTKKAEEQADTAKQEATVHRQRAEANEAAAEKGRAVINLVAAKARTTAPPVTVTAGPTMRSGPRGPEPAGNGGAGAAAGDLAELLEFIQRYDESH
ncbi:MAG: hypothetical protein ACRD0C_18255 [Acidimicrobiia bacterium]